MTSAFTGTGEHPEGDRMLMRLRVISHRDRGWTDKSYPAEGGFDCSFQISEGFQVKVELDLFFMIPPEGSISINRKRCQSFALAIWGNFPTVRDGYQ